MPMDPRTPRQGVAARRHRSPRTDPRPIAPRRCAPSRSSDPTGRGRRLSNTTRRPSDADHHQPCTIPILSGARNAKSSSNHHHVDPTWITSDSIRSMAVTRTVRRRPSAWHLLVGELHRQDPSRTPVRVRSEAESIADLEAHEGASLIDTPAWHTMTLGSPSALTPDTSHAHQARAEDPSTARRDRDGACDANSRGRPIDSVTVSTTSIDRSLPGTPFS